eukprot:NODE_142_length_17801_cov_0.377020.p6 type:complete len:225 gc:universal NODE_142_length_17801_cov_0.377020:3380-2706(-)
MSNDEETVRILKAKSSFEVLKVTPKSSMEDIKKAYKKAALATHPDKNPKGAEAFEKVRKAYVDVEKCKEFAENPFINLQEEFSADQSGIYNNFLSMWQEFLNGNFTHLLNIAELLSAREHIDVDMEDLKRFLQFFFLIFTYFANFIQLFGNDIVRLVHCSNSFTRLPGLQLRKRFSLVFIFWSILLQIPSNVAVHMLPRLLSSPISMIFMYISNLFLRLSGLVQ